MSFHRRSTDHFKNDNLDPRLNNFTNQHEKANNSRGSVNLRFNGTALNRNNNRLSGSKGTQPNKHISLNTAFPEMKKSRISQKKVVLKSSDPINRDNSSNEVGNGTGAGTGMEAGANGVVGSPNATPATPTSLENLTTSSSSEIINNSGTNNTENKSKTVTISKDITPKTEPKPSSSSTHKDIHHRGQILIFNFSPLTAEVDIVRYFKHFGRIRETKMGTDPTSGEYLGFCTIIYTETKPTKKLAIDPKTGKPFSTAKLAAGKAIKEGSLLKIKGYNLKVLYDPWSSEFNKLMSHTMKKRMKIQQQKEEKKKIKLQEEQQHNNNIDSGYATPPITTKDLNDYSKVPKGPKVPEPNAFHNSNTYQHSNDSRYNNQHAQYPRYNQNHHYPNSHTSTIPSPAPTPTLPQGYFISINMNNQRTPSKSLTESELKGHLYGYNFTRFEYQISMKCFYILFESRTDLDFCLGKLKDYLLEQYGVLMMGNHKPRQPQNNSINNNNSNNVPYSSVENRKTSTRTNENNSTNFTTQSRFNNNINNSYSRYNNNKSINDDFNTSAYNNRDTNANSEYGYKFTYDYRKNYTINGVVVDSHEEMLLHNATIDLQKELEHLVQKRLSEDISKAITKSIDSRKKSQKSLKTNGKFIITNGKVVKNVISGNVNHKDDDNNEKEEHEIKSIKSKRNIHRHRQLYQRFESESENEHEIDSDKEQLQKQTELDFEKQLKLLDEQNKIQIPAKKSKLSKKRLAIRRSILFDSDESESESDTDTEKQQKANKSVESDLKKGDKVKSIRRAAEALLESSSESEEEEEGDVIMIKPIIESPEIQKPKAVSKVPKGRKPSKTSKRKGNELTKGKAVKKRKIKSEINVDEKEQTTDEQQQPQQELEINNLNDEALEIKTEISAELDTGYKLPDPALDWNPSFGIAPQAVCTDIPNRLLNLNGIQELVKDTEDYALLKEVLSEIEPTPANKIGNYSYKAWKENEAMATALGKSINEIGPIDIDSNISTDDNSISIPSALENKTGSARSEGYRKIPDIYKANYLPHRRKAHIPLDQVQTHENKSKNETTAKKTKSLSRYNRVANRRFAADLGVFQGETDLFNFNQLMKRRKLVSFARSAIHNWGLYAAEPISAKEMIIEYVGESVRQQVADLREKQYIKSGLGSSYLFRIDEDTVIDSTKMGSVARFINHCCTPTCTAKILKVEGKKRIVIYALRDIAANEEITYDYKFEREINSDERIPCLCGSPQCKGFLN